MESPNFIIDGHLRLPGLVRMPPPFGPPLDDAQTDVATQVSAAADPAAKTCGEAGKATRGQWRQRMTALATGTACTLAAALLGWQTGQHRPPAAEPNQTIVAAVAQPTTPNVLLENLPAEPVASAQTHEPEESETVIAAATAVAQAPDMALDDAEVTRPVIAAASTVVTQLPVKSIRTRMLVRVVEPAPTYESEQPGALHDDESAFIEFEPAPIDMAPIASGYAAPGTPVRIELQRHTRFTD
ncbi:ribonuclease E [Ralstonia sp. Ralssp135]|uniref:ribonuclease E n=1 Tax=Ralstonia sp. Ralssp135 TaxID=3243016 RepID=UPI0039AEEE51